MDRGPFVQARVASFSARGAHRDGAWLEPLRRAAFDRFTALGLPTTHDENWRFTSVAPIGKIPFADAPPADPGTAPLAGPDGQRVLTPRHAREAALAARASFGLESCHRLVFVNGRFEPGLSAARAVPRGAAVGTLAAALDPHRALVEEHLGRHASFEVNAFAALNTALFEDGAFLYLPDGVVIEEPILIVHLSSPGSDPLLSSPRHLLILGRGSRATVVESYAGQGDGSIPGTYFTNAVTEIVSGDGSALEHYKLQDEAESAFHVATIQALLGDGSALHAHSASFGGALVRNDINAVLGEGADCSLNGLFITHGTQHVDNHTLIDHARPHGTSREIYKGILDGRSRGVFDGRVVVRAGAQKTDARQVNRNLLLSEGALIDTKPQLEIRADDVKCAHAATIGRLDETALFYLRSRGLSQETARGLLVRAFAAEVTALVKIDPLRARIEEMVARLLAAGAGAGETS